MKRVFPFILLPVYAVLPLLLIFLSFFGYTVSVSLEFAVFLAAVSAAAIVATLTDKSKETTTLFRVFSLLLLPIALINWFFYVLQSWSRFSVVLMVCSACALIYLVKYCKSTPPFFAVLIISIFLALPPCLLSLFTFFTPQPNVALQTVYSDDNAYKAIVWYSDYGAMGDTLTLDVYDERANIDLYFLQVKKAGHPIHLDTEQYIRSGAELRWADDYTLYFNGTPFSIE